MTTGSPSKSRTAVAHHEVEDIMDEVNTFVRIDAQHRDFWQVRMVRGAPKKNGVVGEVEGGMVD